MSRFYSAEMATIVSLHTHVTIHCSFFGLIASAYYTETGSRINSYENFYDEHEGKEILNLLLLPDKDLLKKTQSIKPFHKLPVCCYRLEFCLSHDRRFMALQLAQYIGFRYTPITEVRFFEGEMAESISRFFN